MQPARVAFVPAARLVLAAALACALLLVVALAPGPAGAVACVVNSVADSGPGTLREKVNDATCDSITFTLPNPSTITLTTGELTIGRNLTITGPGAAALTVSGNNASRVFNVTGGTAVISGLTVTNGRENNGIGGGAIYMNGGVALSLTRVTVRDSFTNYIGGGLYTVGGVVTIAESTFSGNQANEAGAFYNFNSVPNITNSTFSGNLGLGTIILAGTNGATTPTIASSTIAGNTSHPGALVVFSGGYVTLQGTLFANNGGSCFIQNPGTIVNGGYNLDNGSSCGFGSANGSISSANPLLAPLGDYGGPTQTFALLPGSPAIDRVPSTGAGCPATDQRGVARPQPTGGACDSGAFESRGFTMTLVNGNNQSAVINTAFANPLRVEVASAFGEPVQGGRVTFTGPGSGAGIQGSPLSDGINMNGRAGVTPTANGTVGGPYTVAASAAGVATGGNFSLTNLAIPTTLVAADASGAYTGTTNLSATLTATGGAGLSGKTIAFTLNGAAVCGGGGQPACPVTDASGVAALTGVSLGSIGAGSYPVGVGVSFAGDSTTVAASDTAALTVSKAATALTLVRGDATYGDTDGSLRATLRRTNGDSGPVIGATVIFTLNGNPVCGGGGQPACPTTDASGLAELADVAIPAGLGAGSYPGAVGATFGGDTNHLESSSSGPLRVARRIIVVRSVDREVALRQPNPPAAPPADCLAAQTPTSACWLALAAGSSFAPGDDWGDLGIFPARGAGLRFLYSRNYPHSNQTEYVGKTYRISAAGLGSANYDIRYQSGTLKVVAP